MNLLSFRHNGSPVDVFFDIDWKTSKITNVEVTSGGLAPTAQRVHLTDDDRAGLMDAIVAEVALLTIEAAAERKAGITVNA